MRELNKKIKYELLEANRELEEERVEEGKSGGMRSGDRCYPVEVSHLEGVSINEEVGVVEGLKEQDKWLESKDIR